MHAPRRMLLLIAAIAMLQTASFTASQPTSTNTISTPTCALNASSNDIGGCITESISLAMIALLISFAFVGLAYMLGEIFGLESLKGWYKGELKETVKTIAIMVSTFAVLIILGSVAVALAGYPLQQVTSNSAILTGSSATAGTEVTNNMGLLYSSAESSYLSPQLSDAYSSLSSLIGVSLGVGFLKGISLSTWTPFPVPPLPPFVSWIQSGSTAKIFSSRMLELNPGSPPGMSLLGDVMTLVTLPVLSILQVQTDMFGQFMDVALLVLLPMGILLRAIPLLRGIGGTLIALAIGVAIVYPMLLVGFNIPITNYMQATTGMTSHTYASPSCSGTLGSLICFAINLGADIGTVNSLGLSLVVGQSNMDVVALNHGINAGLSSMNSVFPSINIITVDVLDEILQLILFILDLVVTVAAVNAIAGLMGGKLRTGIGRFKLA